MTNEEKDKARLHEIGAIVVKGLARQGITMTDRELDILEETVKAILATTPCTCQLLGALTNPTGCQKHAERQ